MPESGKRPDRPAAGFYCSLIVILALATSACSSSQQDFGIQLGGLSATGTSSSVSFRATQDVRLSQEARDALINGVALRFRVELSVRNPGSWTDLRQDSLVYEIRYLPLSDHYQLTGPRADSVPRTFPRLRHVLAELQGIEWRMGNMNNKPGHYEVRVRSHLDRSGMPGAMQLPMLFSADWNHDSGWVSHEFPVSG